MGAKKRIVGELALIAAGIVAAFFIAEIGLRIVAPRPNFYVYDAHCGWALNPGVAGWERQEGKAWVAINREGFRGPEVAVKKPPNTIRIAVLGDSFTEAQQVPMRDTFCAVMRRELSNCGAFAGKKIQVLDFGVDGYGTAQELITLKRQVWKFHPDVVVLAFFSGNDVRNNSVALEGDKCRPFFVYRGGELTLGGPFSRSRWFRFHCMMRFESRHSYVLNRIGSGWSVAREWWRKRRADPPAPAKIHLESLHEPGISDLIYRRPVTPVWRDAWRVTDGEIVRMYQEVRRHRASFILVTLSNPIQVNPSRRIRAGYMRFVGVSDLFYPERHLRKLGGKEGFPVLNLAPAMQAYADRTQVFLHGFRNTKPGTGHWNAAGHHLAGKYIAGTICGLIKGKGFHNTVLSAK
ncbi:MAG: SGNH/GDSL hydrolase family protein [Candidatus Binataceae bacterium]